MVKVTQKQIAEAAGVSPAAVSAALSGQAEARGISPDTAERILEVGRSLGYVPAQRRERALARTIGLVLRQRVRFFLNNPFYASIYSGIVEELARHDFHVLFSLPQEELVELLSLPRVVSQRKVDGLILLGELPFDYVGRLVDFGVRLVCVNFEHSPEVTSVLIDGRAEATAAMAYLHQLGHCRIAYLCDQNGSQHSLGRLEGYRANLPADVAACVIEADGGDIENGERAIREYLGRHDRRALPFSCLLAENDFLAIGAIRAFREAGLSVPDDVGVMGGQDFDPQGRFDCALTTTGVSKTAMGHLAARALVEAIIEDRDQAVKMVVPTTIVERGSVRPVSPEGES